jgi:GNAT superfamily N-acetyltransferase
VTRPPVDVRQAGGGDADDLIELWVQARAEIAGAGRAVLGGAPDVIRPRLLDALSRQDDLHVLLARWEGRPAGFAVVRVGHLMPLADDDCVQLEHLFVTPSLRRHGVARALLGAVAGLAERHGADQILSGAPPSAREVHRFLARLGFTPLVLRRVTATATLRRRLAGESRRSALEDLLSRRRSLRAKSVRAATPPHGIALVPAPTPACDDEFDVASAAALETVPDAAIPAAIPTVIAPTTGPATRPPTEDRTALAVTVALDLDVPTAGS